MILISEESIDNAIERYEGMEDAELKGLFDTFAEEQPYLFTFCMTMGQQMNNEDLQELLIEYLLLIWQSFKMETGKVGITTEVSIEESETHVMQVLEDINFDLDDMESDENITAYLNSFQQTNIVRFVTEEIINFLDNDDDDDIETDADNEDAGILLSCLLISIESLDRVTG